jgi:hypothetical protein
VIGITRHPLDHVARSGDGTEGGIHLIAGDAGVALVLDALHPAPWLLALGLVTLLSATWCLAFLRLLAGATSKA